MAISWLGGRVSFPKHVKKKKKAARRKSFSNKDMMGIYLLSNLAGRWMSAKLYWEVDFDMGVVPVKKTLVLSGSVGNKNLGSFSTSRTFLR